MNRKAVLFVTMMILSIPTKAEQATGAAPPVPTISIDNGEGGQVSTWAYPPQDRAVQKKSLPQVTGRIVLAPGPGVDSPDRPAYRPNAINGIETKQAVGVGASAYTPWPDNYVASPSEIITYQNSRYRLEAGIHGIASEPVSPDRYSWRITSSEGTVNMSGTLGGTYSTAKVGVPYGNDRREGTADDPSRLMSGSTAIPSEEIIAIGPSIFYEAPTAAKAEEIKSYLIANNVVFKFELFFDGRILDTKLLRFGPISPPPPPNPFITSFTANSTTVSPGHTVTFTWSTTPGATVTISGVAGTHPSSGNVTVQVLHTTTFRLTATLGGISVQSQDITVFVPQPPPPPSTFTISMSAVPSTITTVPEQTSAISWEVSPSTANVAIFPDIGNVPSSGTRNVKPPRTQLYTLTASGPGFETRQASVLITVVPPPPTGFTITAIISLSHSGSVPQGTALMLKGTIINNGPGMSGSVTGFWEYVADSGTVWSQLVPDGFAANLVAGQGFESQHPWAANNTGNYRLRLRVRSSDGRDWHSNEVAIQVTPVQIVPASSGVLKIILFTGTPGTRYDILHSQNANGPWSVLTSFRATTGNVQFIDVPQGSIFPSRGFFETRVAANQQ